MNHYPHHIGDFDRATRHLTRIERAVYRDLMDLYYDTEMRLTLDMAKLCRRIIAKSKIERAAVAQALQPTRTRTRTRTRTEKTRTRYPINHRKGLTARRVW